MKVKVAVGRVHELGEKVWSGKRWYILGLILVLLWTDPRLVWSVGEAEIAVQAPTIPLKTAPESVIEQRLRAVIENIDDFQNVKIDVNAGVVRLSGKTSRVEASENVARMVSRFEGVIYVDNQIEVETNVETRVRPALARARQYLTISVQKLPSIGVALAVILVFWMIARAATSWDLPFQRLGLNRLLRNLIRQFLRKGIILLGVLLALDILDLTALVGAMLGTAGVIGLAIGFAFKDIVENYLAGLLLSIRRPFGLHDIVRIESHEGRVIRLTASELVLMTFKTLRSTLTPASCGFHFAVGVGVNEDLLNVQSHGFGALRNMEGVLADPEPFMRVEELGDYNVLVRFFGWVDQRVADFVKVRSEAIRRVKLAFDEAGVEMPEPVQNIRLQRAGIKPPGTTATLAPLAQRSDNQETESVDVSPDTQLDEQINAELAATDESNLLTDA